MIAGPQADVVVPTVGRPSLYALLDALAASTGPLPGRMLLVDDRREPDGPLLPSGVPPRLASRVTVLLGRAVGPAAARNVGWRASDAEWVAFLDDDVIPHPDWPARFLEDLVKLGPGGREPGRLAGTAAEGPSAHRLGEERQGPGEDVLDHRRHGLQAGGPG